MNTTPASPIPMTIPTTMQAILRTEYCAPTDLTVQQVPVPTPAPDQVLLRVRAASLNPAEWHTCRGEPRLMRLQAGLRRPKQTVLGADVAGTVVAVGRDVTDLAVGDEVVGGADGSFAEYALGRPRSLTIRPPGLDAELAASLPIAGITALQAVRDRGRVTAGQAVLVNGASGGVGTFAVQIAAALGAEVTGVCSTGNVELVRSLGATHVVDYTSDDVTAGGRQFDVIVDNIGNHRFAAISAMLRPGGAYVVVGGPKTGRWLGPLVRLAGAKLRFAVGPRRCAAFIASLSAPGDMATLVEMVGDGRVRPVVDHTCALADVPAELEQLGHGHTRGKVVVRVAAPLSA